MCKHISDTLVNDIFFSFLGKTLFHKYEYKMEEIKRKKNDMQMFGDVFS